MPFEENVSFVFVAHIMHDEKIQNFVIELSHKKSDRLRDLPINHLHQEWERHACMLRYHQQNTFFI